MKSRNLTPGSLWRVLPVRCGIVGSTTGLDVSCHPLPHWVKDPVSSWLAPSNSIVVVGSGTSVPSLDAGKGEWVEIILPRRGYINRTHFNQGSLRLEPIL